MAITGDSIALMVGNEVRAAEPCTQVGARGGASITDKDALARFRVVLATHPKRLVIAFVGLPPKDGRGLTAMKAALRTMVAETRRAGVQPVVVLPTSSPVTARETLYQSAITDTLPAWRAWIAARWRLTLDWTGPLTFPDTLHPDAAGVAVLTARTLAYAG